MNKLLIYLGIGILFFCLVDPLDKIFGLKLFTLLLFFIVYILKNYTFFSNKKLLPKSIVYFVFLFSIFIPISSLLMHPMVFDFQYYKPYFFLFVAIPFYTIEFDFIKPFVRILDFLCIVNVFLFLFILINPDLLLTVYDFGEFYSVFSMPTKNYGSFSYIALYFQISPLFIFALCFNINKYFKFRSNTYLTLLLINFLALLICGSRNNIIGAILAPVLFYYFFNKITLSKIFISIVFLFFLLYNTSDLVDLFSKPDSDTTKINFMTEYLNIFSNPINFFAGQGIGSDFFTSSRGNSSNTELTYFEIIRRLGIILGIFQIFMMFFPILFALFRKTVNQWIFLPYFIYLLMSISNPFYFNSSGMLLLSFVLIEIARNKKNNSLQHIVNI
jgi:hypothetical protein